MYMIMAALARRFNRRICDSRWLLVPAARRQRKTGWAPAAL